MASVLNHPLPAGRLPISVDQLEHFSRRWQVLEMSLFGSILRTDYGPESDVDVLVRFEPSAPWSLWDLFRMRDELASLFGRKIDLIEEKALRNPFRRRAILRDKRVIYAAR